MHMHLIDASGLIHAAFYGSGERARADGMPTNAINAWAWWIHNWLVRNTDHAATMSHIVAVFDAGGETFRHRLYPEYKAGRGPKPDEFIRQRAACRMAVKAFGVPALDLAGVEADDIIATLTHAFLSLGDDAAVTILSHDKDLIQLLTPGVNLVRPDRKERDENVIEYDDADAIGAVFKVGGPLDVHHVVGLQALAGDSSDNIPGCPGVGPKKAAGLLRQFGYLDNIFARLDELPDGKMKRDLAENQELVELSERLVRLNTEIDIIDGLHPGAADPVKIENLRVRKPNIARLRRFMETYELDELARRALPFHGGAE